MDDSAVRKRDTAIRAAEPYLAAGYVIHELDASGITLRKRPSGPSAYVALWPALYWMLRALRRPARYVVLTTDDNGVVTTTFR